MKLYVTLQDVTYTVVEIEVDSNVTLEQLRSQPPFVFDHAPVVKAETPVRRVIKVEKGFV